MEVSALGLYMFLTCGFATLVHHPDSPLRHAVPSATARRALMGAGMGLAIIAIIISPWGKQSGGHFNPAITVAFYRLGKVEFWDAWFYLSAQFTGAGGVDVHWRRKERGSRRSQIYRRILSEHRLPAEQEHHSQRQGRTKKRLNIERIAKSRKRLRFS
jgi:hypothetical protein